VKYTAVVRPLSSVRRALMQLTVALYILALSNTFVPLIFSEIDPFQCQHTIVSF